MKKIILVILLLASTISFSVPNRVNIDRINKYYEILVDGDERFSYYTNLEDGSTIIITYFIEEMEDAAKFLNVSIKEEHMALFDYISSIETKRAYLHKFYDSEEEKYLYFVIRKKPKIKNYYITGILKTRKDYQRKSLNKIIKRIINTGKKNLK